MRTHVSPWSTPLIHRSWKIAWAATREADAATTAKIADFMVAAQFESGLSETAKMKRRYERVSDGTGADMVLSQHKACSIPQFIWTAPREVL
jgi:hypothetical protein